VPDVPRGPVAVTGLGVVSPFGWGVASFRNGLRGGCTAIAPFDRFDATGHRTHVAAQVPPPPAELPAPVRVGRRLSWADRFGLAAALEAVQEAGLDPEAVRGAGVFFGSSTGGMLEGESFYAEACGQGSSRVRVSLLAMQQTSAPGEAVARHLGCEGPVETISSACASGAMALAAAAEAIGRGEIQIALAGGADALCRLTYGGFNALRSVSETACLPFRSERTGLSLGEGGAVLVLEPLERALGRGARPRAVLRGGASTCDAHHMTAPHPEGRGAAEAIRAAMAQASVTPDDVDFVNAHGTGTPLNDAAEWEALRSVFGDRTARLPVTSTKALLGHLLGSAGALEAAATVLCLAAREIHPMPEGGTADPVLPLDLVLGRPRVLERARNALTVNLAFGGANAALVISTFGEARP
jgi:3-oxoacyl-[acyl-carrier-protein] synthase II